MPYAMTYLDEGKGVVLEYRGVVTNAEYVDARREFQARDKALFPCIYCLKDLEGATLEKVPTVEIREGAMKYWRAHDPAEAVCAFVVSDVLNYGIVRMWQAYVEQPGWEVRIFGKRELAAYWIKDRVEAKFGFPATVK